MFKSISIASIFFAFLSIDIHAQIVKQPVMVQSLPSFEFPKMPGYADDQLEYAIYFLVPNPDHNLQIIYYNVASEPCYPFPGYYRILHTNLTTWDIIHAKILDTELINGNLFPVSNLIHDASSVTINGKQIILEDSYLPFIVVNEGGYGFSLQSVELSPSQKYVGGIIMYCDDYLYGTILSLWDANTGDTIYREYPTEPFLYRSDFNWIYNRKIEPKLIDLHFTLDENYLITREFWGDNYRNISIPRAKMLDLKKWEFITVDRDVAFSSDMRYMVTERNGLPSLVDLESNTIIHQYQVEYPMTACCFSPDDSQVYITTIINELHIFDSGLQSTAPCWEVY